MTRLLDITGKKFNRWAVLGRAPSRPNSRGGWVTYWHCRCDCGTAAILASSSIRGGNSRSCGCHLRDVLLARNKPADDLTGQRFGMLVAGRYIAGKKFVSSSRYECHCDCGNTCEAVAGHLRKGRWQSCGCRRKRLFAKDLTGMVFGGLTVLGRTAGFKKRVKWTCRCHCGKILSSPINTHLLNSCSVKSCGCIKEAVIDKTRFANITTEEEAYWLGMLYTDGNITSRKHGIRLTLKASDVDHVREFARFMGTQKEPSIRMVRGGSWFPNGSMRRDGLQADFSVHSPTVHANLVAQGCTPRKTWTCTPWVGPEYLMRHFWRGCVDGDGWVCVGRKQVVIGLCGNVAMVKGLRDFILNQTGFKGRYSESEPIGVAARAAGLKFAKVTWNSISATDAVASLLYGDCQVSLARKKAKIGQLLHFNANRPPIGRPRRPGAHK